MKRALGAIFFALVVGSVLLAAVRVSGAVQGELPGDPIEGGRVYDNWIQALDLEPPQGNQPLWETQTDNPRSGVVTWRCVECHGWDYKGLEGSYGPSSTHYTGFPSLNEMVGAGQDEVRAWLDGSNNPQHNFLFYTTRSAVDDLIAFLLTQQVDTDLLIDPSTGLSYGNLKRGRALYQGSCESCHGERGETINFGSENSPLNLGDLAVADPWQTVHVIRFGDPIGRMQASEQLGWSLNMVADVLAYTQTLPRANPEYGITLSNSDETIDVENQGDIEPIIWAAFAMMLLIGASLGWDHYQQRQGT